MIKDKILVAFILYYYSTGVLTKTVIEDLNDFISKIEQNLTNISYEELTKRPDPCDSFVPLVADFSELKSVSEIKCKEYIWNAINREIESGCSIHHKNKSTNSSENVMGFSDIPVILGGRNAESAEFTHMAAVGWRSKEPTKKWVFKCGSSLISDKFLLTAAHCTSISPRSVLDIVNSQPEIVMLGVENISNTVDTSTRRRSKLEKILNIIVHPAYQPPKKYNDIALLELENPIQFTSFILPACIWPHNDVRPFEDTVSLTGWGLTESGKPSPILQVAEVDIIDTETCENLLAPFKNRNWNGFIETQMCAGKLSGGIDTCQGDSGGPVQGRIRSRTQDKMYMIIGVTSFGVKCGVKNRPGVYTRVSSYVPWIEEIVWSQNKTLKAYSQNSTYTL